VSDVPGFFLAVGITFGAGVWLLWDTASIPSPPQGVLHNPSPRSTFLLRVQSLLREAGHPKLDPGLFLVTATLTALAGGALVAWAVPIPVLSVLTVVAMVFAGFAYVRKQRDARFHRLQQAWPGVIDHLRAGIRSGSDVTTAVMALPDSLPPDIAHPVAEFRVAINRGLDTDSALAELATRFANPVSDRICEVLRMAHEVGGTDLPSVLLQLQQSVRSDIALRADARAAQSWIRSAALLALCAPWIVLVVIGTREQTASSYHSVEGTIILLVGAVVSVVAYRMMKKIGELPEASRWLA
jgi:tight adherence protein B